MPSFWDMDLPAKLPVMEDGCHGNENFHFSTLHYKKNSKGYRNANLVKNLEVKGQGHQYNYSKYGNLEFFLSFQGYFTSQLAPCKRKPNK